MHKFYDVHDFFKKYINYNVHDFFKKCTNYNVRDFFKCTTNNKLIFEINQHFNYN